MHCTQTQTKMAASDEDVVQQISSACAIAKEALEAIGNLQSNDIRNVAALTATNSSSTSSSPSSSSGSIALELARRFPSYNARARGVASRRKRPSTSTSSSSLACGKKNGRPSKTIVHKDLVIIPNPNTNQVPSHVSKVKLEERGLIIHQLPFNKDWTPLDLKTNIESQLPRDDIMFEYLKVIFHLFVLLFVLFFFKRNYTYLD